MSTVLIIEDEKELSNVLKAYLERGGYDVLTAERGDRGLALWQEHHPDIILLDLNLPGMDGIDIAREVRQTDDTPLIMVTARVDEVDRLLGLELGADDYVVKPFSPKELVARVRAVLRRAGGQKEPTVVPIAAGDLTIDPARRSVRVGEQAIELTTTEFDLLWVLAESPGRVFTRLELLDRVQGDAYEGYERTIDVHIKNLRKKLEVVPQKPQYIQTVYGVGYKFSEDWNA